MKVFKRDRIGVARIEFCCNEMAEDIPLRRVITNQWTDHALAFRVGDYWLSHCGHCGAKIEGELFAGGSDEKN